VFIQNLGCCVKNYGEKTLFHLKNINGVTNELNAREDAEVSGCLSRMELENTS
jgi:hypothetical protein